MGMLNRRTAMFYTVKELTGEELEETEIEDLLRRYDEAFKTL